MNTPWNGLPVVARRNHPCEARVLDGLVRRGTFRRLLPGVYAPAEVPDSFELRVLAAQAWAPQGIVVGAAAAKLLWWPDLDVEQIEIHGGRRADPAPWLTARRRTVPPSLRVSTRDINTVIPAASTLQLAGATDGNSIDEALRRGVVTLGQLQEAQQDMAGLLGSRAARRLLRDSRDEPWSSLEREAHRRLRRARISGWRANLPVRVAGQVYRLDIGFPRLRLALELDGFQVHSERHTFHADRTRQNQLVMAGWTVLRFTWNSLDDLVPHVRQFSQR